MLVYSIIICVCIFRFFCENKNKIGGRRRDEAVQSTQKLNNKQLHSLSKHLALTFRIYTHTYIHTPSCKYPQQFLNGHTQDIKGIFNETRRRRRQHWARATAATKGGLRKGFSVHQHKTEEIFLLYYYLILLHIYFFFFNLNHRQEHTHTYTHLKQFIARIWFISWVSSHFVLHNFLFAAIFLLYLFVKRKLNKSKKS